MPTIERYSITKSTHRCYGNFGQSPKFRNGVLSFLHLGLFPLSSSTLPKSCHAILCHVKFLQFHRLPLITQLCHVWTRNLVDHFTTPFIRQGRRKFICFNCEHHCSVHMIPAPLPPNLPQPPPLRFHPMKTWCRCQVLPQAVLVGLMNLWGFAVPLARPTS